MVMIALAVALLPVALGGMIMQPQPQWPQQAGWDNSGWGNSGWGNSGWGNSGWGMQMQGVVYPQQQQQQQQQQQAQNNAWWSTASAEDYEAYIKWCQERQLAMQEQEQQKQLLEEIRQRAEQQRQMVERERANKEMQSKREAMMAQWRMWQTQLSSAEQFTDLTGQFTEMKTHYMYKLTLEYLKFCRCSDYTSHLQRYLIYGNLAYEPSNTDVFSLEDLDGIDTNDVEAVAQRLAALSEAEGVKLYFGGLIDSMCESVRVYVDQVKAWEAQYNFLGM